MTFIKSKMTILHRQRRNYGPIVGQVFLYRLIIKNHPIWISTRVSHSSDKVQTHLISIDDRVRDSIIVDDDSNQAMVMISSHPLELAPYSRSIDYCVKEDENSLNGFSHEIESQLGDILQHYLPKKI